MASLSGTPKPVRVRPVPAVSRSIAILRLLGETKQGLGVKAIADALGLVPSTCLHILRVLVSEDLVRVDPSTKRYALAAGMISLARSVLGSEGFAQMAQSSLDRLAATYGVTAMGVEVTATQSVVVLGLSKSTQPFRLYTDVGSHFDDLVSATGRLIAAHSGENWTQLRKRFDAVKWDKPPKFATWKSEVEMARAKGWSEDRDNFVSGLTVIAVPIFNDRGQLTYTLVVAGLSSHLPATLTQTIAAAMRKEAQDIENTLNARSY